MFGYSAFGERSFGELDAADSIAARIATLYYSDKGFITAPGDTPASQYYESVVQQPLEFFRHMIGGDRIGGVVSGQQGRIVLNNIDGGLDTLLDNYAIDGRRVVVKMGRPDFTYDNFGTIFDGIAAGWESTERELRIRTQDKLVFLRRNIQPNVYLGTGGIEGGDDLKDRPKPLCFGKVFNIPAIPVDTANLVYQVHNGVVNTIPAAYDRGVALTNAGDFATVADLLAATTGIAGSGADIEAGEYATCLAQGVFRLGGEPTGQVTTDVEGDADPTYVSVTSDLVERVLLRYSGLSESDLDQQSFQTFFNDNTATVGLWIDTTQVLIIDVIAQLLAGVGGFMTTDRFGKVQAGVFKVATGQPDITLTDAEILEIEQEALPTGISPPNWRRQVAYQRNYTVQTDIAGSVDADRRAFIRQPSRIATAVDSTTQVRHLFATDPPVVPGLFANQAEGASEATRLLQLYKSDRRIYRVTTKHRVYNYKLNQVVSLDYDRWDLAGGKIGRVVGVDNNAASNSAILRVFV